MLTIVDYFKGEYAAKRLTTPYDAYRALTGNAENFLRKYPVDIDEGSSANSSVRTSYIINGGEGRRPGSVMGVRAMKTTESFRIRERPDAELTDRACYYPFPAHFVAMIPSNRNINWYPLTGGPDVMLTCKLTGCSFVVRKENGQVEAAHLQPTDEDGLDLNRRLAQPGQKAYGRLDYNFDKRAVTILGVRSGGQWRIFAQKWNKLETKTPSVISVHQIFQG